MPGPWGNAPAVVPPAAKPSSCCSSGTGCPRPVTTRQQTSRGRLKQLDWAVERYWRVVGKRCST